MITEAAKQAQKKYLATNNGKKKAKIAKRKYRLSEKGQRVHASSLLQQRYGISLKYKELMYIEQCGLCKLCGRVLDINARKSAVDHDHNTGEVRGLLHPFCNWFIGVLERYKTLIDLAFVYLKWPRV